MKKLRFTNGYETVPYGLHTQELVRSLANAWSAFLRQPLEEKLKLSYVDGVGYENKGPDDPDYKEDFHITLAYTPDYNRNLSVTTALFIKAAHDVLENQSIVMPLAELLTESSDFNFVERMMANPERWIVRCLYYPPQQREFLAAEHPDKGPATLHVYDSTPGLQGYWNGSWKALDFKHGEEAVCYPGLLGQYYSKCNVKALPHRVVSTQESRANGRISVVLFADFETEVRYNKPAFGRTQDVFKNGSNIGMSFEEFETYFTQVLVGTPAD